MARRTGAGSWIRFLLWPVVGLIGVVGVYAVAAPLLEIGGVVVPRAELPRVRQIPQGWDDDVTFRFHRQSQGTKIMPLAWFMALEQPVLTPLPVGRFADRNYLARYGFMYDSDKPRPGKPDLPIGFAIEEQYVAAYDTPPVEKPTSMVGLSCSACHSGRIDVAGPDGRVVGVLIDGGSAMIDLGSFEEAVGKALLYTKLIPLRWSRFASNVLGANLPNTDSAKQKLLEDLTAAAAVVEQLAKEEQNYGKFLGGFSRTDALARIGNRVFGDYSKQNLIKTDAPVNFPHLWGTAWFDWVQYNASVRTPMTRNIGESLGVGAVVNLTKPELGLYNSTVNVPGLHWLETALGGVNPFEGLQAPRWEDMAQAVFGGPPSEQSGFALNPERISKGAILYEKHCQYCHLPPMATLKADYNKNVFTHFTEPDKASKKRFIKVKVVDLNVTGTDPNQALNFVKRTAVMPEPIPWVKPEAPVANKGGARYGSNDWYGSEWVRASNTNETIASLTGGAALYQVTSMIRRLKYQDLNRPYEENLNLLVAPNTAPAQVKPGNDAPARKDRRIEFDRYRGVEEALDFGEVPAIVSAVGMDEYIVANLGYKARPLDGIWATPPYLHNSSVPNLYEILVPAAQRTAKFYLGSTRFDPKHVGFETQQFPGAFLMDTSKSGNLNTGHEFRNLTLEELEQQRGIKGNGRSSRDQRWAFVLGKDLESFLAASERERWELKRDATRAELEKHKGEPIPGLYGPEFTEEERWELVEYLKSL
jgi:hypothetical protein